MFSSPSPSPLSTPAGNWSSLFVEQLTVIDCTVLDAARGLVGESWIVDIELEGELDAQSMVLDFGLVKKRLKQALDQSVDHTLLVPLLAPGLALTHVGDRIDLEYTAPPSGGIVHCSPRQALSLIDTDAVDAASLADHLGPILAAVVPPNVASVHVHLRTERIDGAQYRYSHGLKKHDGHCQRIAHGHRSRLEIHVDGQRDAALERAQAARWAEIYLGTRSDLVSTAGNRHHYRYEAAEGRFELELPAERCDLLDADTTVECIAEHLARVAAAERPGRAITVRAYEGVMKGAIARIASAHR